MTQHPILITCAVVIIGVTLFLIYWNRKPKNVTKPETGFRFPALSGIMWNLMTWGFVQALGLLVTAILLHLLGHSAMHMTELDTWIAIIVAILAWWAYFDLPIHKIGDKESARVELLGSTLPKWLPNTITDGNVRIPFGVSMVKGDKQIVIDFEEEVLSMIDPDKQSSSKGSPVSIAGTATFKIVDFGKFDRISSQTVRDELGSIIRSTLAAKAAEFTNNQLSGADNSKGLATNNFKAEFRGIFTTEGPNKDQLKDFGLAFDTISFDEVAEDTMISYSRSLALAMEQLPDGVDRTSAFKLIGASGLGADVDLKILDIPPGTRLTNELEEGGSNH